MKLKNVLLETSNDKDETLWEGEYISIKKKDGWYEYLHDGTGKLVVVLGHRHNNKDGGREYLGRYENTPPHGEGIKLCSLTGGIEEKEEPISAAVRELNEESGISKKKEDFKSLGDPIRPSKASDSFAYLFSVDCSDEKEKSKYTGKGDGTKGEQGAYCKWITEQELLEGKDALLITAYARLMAGFDKE